MKPRKNKAQAPMARVQAVTHFKLEGYRTTLHSCTCVDFGQGGSFSSPDHRDCKHTIKLASEVAHFKTRRMGTYWVCGCSEWDNSEGEGLEGSCLHTKALQGWKSAKGELAHV